MTQLNKKMAQTFIQDTRPTITINQQNGYIMIYMLKHIGLELEERVIHGEPSEYFLRGVAC